MAERLPVEHTQEGVVNTFDPDKVALTEVLSPEQRKQKTIAELRERFKDTGRSIGGYENVLEESEFPEPISKEERDEHFQYGSKSGSVRIEFDPNEHSITKKKFTFEDAERLAS